LDCDDYFSGVGVIEFAVLVETKPYLVLGLGETGLSCVRFLRAQGLPVIVNDSRESPPCLADCQRLFPEVSISLGGFDASLIASAKTVIVSPGIDVNEPALSSAQPIGDIELFAQSAQAPIIAITGSNGKSTVTQLIYEMVLQAGFSAQIGGNIGTPALDLLHQPVPDFYVLELSSFQLSLVDSLNAKAATILNISPDHLDRHGSMQAYTQAKQRIYHGCQYAIINHALIGDVSPFPVPSTTFGLGQGDFSCDAEQRTFLHQGQSLMPTDQMHLKGGHHRENALAALALGHAVGLPWDAMCETLRHFKGLPHRCQWVKSVNGVDFFNDSKGTNIAATATGIGCIAQQISGKIMLIAGGLAKDQDFTPLLLIISAHVGLVVLIGQDRDLLAAALAQAVPIQYADTMLDAITKANAAAHPDDAVLLSPACASFDMFEDYQDRGVCFIEGVRGL
jgi:UDP-N-acetylmuramoylalanine--D-glutamate ligase